MSSNKPMRAKRTLDCVVGSPRMDAFEIGVALMGNNVRNGRLTAKAQLYADTWRGIVRVARRYRFPAGWFASQLAHELGRAYGFTIHRTDGYPMIPKLPKISNNRISGFEAAHVCNPTP